MKRRRSSAPAMKWTKRQDQRLRQAVLKYGTQWSIITKKCRFQRSINSLVKRWHGKLKQQPDNQISQSQSQSQQNQKPEVQKSKTIKKQKKKQQKPKMSRRQRQKQRQAQKQRIKQLQTKRQKPSIKQSQSDRLKQIQRQRQKQRQNQDQKLKKQFKQRQARRKDRQKQRYKDLERQKRQQIQKQKKQQKQKRGQKQRQEKQKKEQKQKQKSRDNQRQRSRDNEKQKPRENERQRSRDIEKDNNRQKQKQLSFKQTNKQKQIFYPKTRHQKINASPISQQIGNNQKSDDQVQNQENHFSIQLKQNYVYQHDWKQSEDNMLKNFIVNQMILNWQDLCQKLKINSEKQIKKRWQKHIYPSIVQPKKIGGCVKYSQEQDAILNKGVKLGMSITQLRKFLPHRTFYSLDARRRRTLRIEQQEIPQLRYWIKKMNAYKFVQKRHQHVQKPVSQQSFLYRSQSE